ncbi:MAG: cyclic nucleotide-binding domain-containing protein [Deltaproteobacteria bacterium]|nr:cyclic nucleotide-binding domain-containing protein [Deltaproteobacteria bacterium]
MTFDWKRFISAKEKAETFYSRGMLKEAISAYEEISAFGMNDPKIVLRKAEIARKMNDIKRAVGYFKEALDAYTAMGELIKAVALSKVIVALDPEERDVEQRLAGLYAGVAEEKDNIKGLEKEQAARLPRIPLFSDLSPHDLREVVRETRLKRFDIGSEVFREGDKGDSLFVVVSGELEVVAASNEGDILSYARLKDGDFFGEFSFFSGQARSGTVRAVRDSELLELKRPDIESIIARRPDIKDVLSNFYRERVVDRLLALSALFRFLSPEDRAAMLKQACDVSFEVGAMFVKEGESGDAVYLIKEGKVMVWTIGEDGERKAVAELSAGDFIGEIAMATARPRSASVTALTKVQAVSFRRKAVKEAIKKHPEVKEALERMVKERMTDVYRIKRSANFT